MERDLVADALAAADEKEREERERREALQREHSEQVMQARRAVEAPLRGRLEAVLGQGYLWKMTGAWRPSPAGRPGEGGSVKRPATRAEEVSCGTFEARSAYGSVEVTVELASGRVYYAGSLIEGLAQLGAAIKREQARLAEPRL